MSDLNRVTPAQEAILDTYTCQRLTEDPENRFRIQQFTSLMGRNLVWKLREDAWLEDTDGLPAAYYVVKNAEGKIAAFFSLKCGVLCDPEYVSRIWENYDRSKELMDALNDQPSKEWAYEYLEQLRTASGEISYLDQMKILTKYLDASDARTDIKMEKMSDPNRKRVRVDEAFPAIELVHFCVNDRLRSEWAALDMPRGMGEVFFWKFIVPKMMEIHRLIGCEYVYLFAADSSADGTLVNYYEHALHFERPDKIGCVKPRYDFLCTFMCKRLYSASPYRRACLAPDFFDGEDPLGLADYRERFWEHFNEMPAME